MYVIFSIDHENNPLRMNVFHNYLACIPQEDREGNFLPMLGRYAGKTEHSFICNEDDFEAYIRGTIYMNGQESIIRIASGNKMEASLEYLEGSMSAPPGTRVSLGCMHQVCKEEAMQAEAWTHSPSLGHYWIAKKGNPDNSYSKSVAEFRHNLPAMDAPVFERTGFGHRHAAE